MMKAIVPALVRALSIPLAALVAQPAQAQSCQGGSGAGKVRLSVEVAGVRSAKGDVVYAIYPDVPSKFLAKGAKVGKARVRAGATGGAVCFWLPAGAYAAALYHDENGDGHLNRTLFAPKEGYAFSNDAPTTLGLPSFKSVRFTVPAAGRTIRVRMRYP